MAWMQLTNHFADPLCTQPFGTSPPAHPTRPPEPSHLLLGCRCPPLVTLRHMGISGTTTDQKITKKKVVLIIIIRHSNLSRSLSGLSYTQKTAVPQSPFFPRRRPLSVHVPTTSPARESASKTDKLHQVITHCWWHPRTSMLLGKGGGGWTTVSRQEYCTRWVKGWSDSKRGVETRNRAKQTDNMPQPSSFASQKEISERPVIELDLGNKERQSACIIHVMCRVDLDVLGRPWMKSKKT